MEVTDVIDDHNEHVEHIELESSLSSRKILGVPIPHYINAETIKEGCIKVNVDWSELTTWTKVFLVCAVIDTVIIISCQIGIFALGELLVSSGRKANVSGFSLIMGAVNLSIYAIDAIVTSNPLQLAAFLVQSLVFIINAVPQVRTTYSFPSSVGTQLCVVLNIATMCAVTLINAVCLYFMWPEFSYRMYLRVGADKCMRNLYRTFQIFVMLLKMEVVWVAMFLLQQLIFIRNSVLVMTFTSLGLIFVLLTFIATFWGVRFENRKCLIVYFLVSGLGVIYFAYMSYNYACSIDDIGSHFCRSPDLKSGFSDILLLAVCTLSIVVCSFIFGILAFSNFNKGLKPIIIRPSHNEIASDDEAQKRMEDLRQRVLNNSDAYVFSSAADQLPPSRHDHSQDIAANSFRNESGEME